MKINSKPSILIAARLPGEPENKHKEEFDLSYVDCQIEPTKLIESAKDKDAIVCSLQTNIGAELLSRCQSLKVVANTAVGYDNIDVDAATKAKILVTNTPGILDESTADLAFALILATARRLTEAERFLRNGAWKYFSLDLLLGSDVNRKTLGIVGLGRIGKAVAKRASGFSMKVLYNQRNSVGEEEEKRLNASFCSLPELLANSDFLSLHCPLSSATRHLIGEKELKLMKKSAFLINTARGAIIEEEALIRALKEGTIAGAGLDVFANEPAVPAALAKLDNVVLLPHIGSATRETREAMAAMALKSAINVLSGVLPSTAVNGDIWPFLLQRLGPLRSR